MSFPVTVLKRSILAVLLPFLATPVFAQAPNSPIVFSSRDGVTTSFVDAPVMGGSTDSAPSSGNTQWLKVEFHYAITPANGAFQDEVQFKVWIEGRDMYAKDAADPKQGIAIGLTGTVTYRNIPANKDCYGVFYVHPSTISRYSSKDGGTDDFDRKFNVHVEAYVGGAKMDYIDKNPEKDPNWFMTLKAIPDLVYRQDQSPFLMTDISRYPAIKLPASQ